MGSVTELAWGCLDTPVGQVSVACTDAGVARVTYGPPPGAAPAPALGTLAAVLLEAALAELEEYFGGHRKAFSVPVDLGSARGSRRTVLSMLHRSVPFGQTITYGGLAARAGLDAAADPGGAFVPPARVVGQIMASNPVALIVPCHRVVAGTGLGGYSGGTGTDVKQWLLVFEGAIPATLDWDAAGLPDRTVTGRQAKLTGSAST
jgi:methylated-DNA-[protein]-cysteine S-methyltransferase